MQISNSIGQGGTPEWRSGRSARPGFPARIDEPAGRQNTSTVPNGEVPASQTVPAGEPVPLLAPPTPPSKAQSLDESLIRGRLMDGKGGTLSNQRAVAQYASVAAQPERSHLAEVLGVDAYA